MIKKYILENPNLSPNFIGSWLIDYRICDEIIAYYEKNQIKQYQGVTAQGLDLESKIRSDISIIPKDIVVPGNEIFEAYFKALFECYKEYNHQWPFLASMVSKLEIGKFNIGKYLPGQHFKRVHSERSSLNTLHRLFAFMTYLNDVEEGGSTYFTHYDLSIKPKRGLTLIWPAEWTHAHRGNILESGSKYIITGWLNFPT